MPKKYEEINENECDLAEPNAAPMIESLRAFGYELPSAIADLVDNSIFADAKNIWVDFFWDGENSAACVTDDGAGMTEVELVEAMRPGSCNPLEVRDPKDLGRYGLGLKTASFSQCRLLTVLSKTASDKQVIRSWDLDFVALKNKWLLLRDGGEYEKRLLERIKQLNRGTAVLWGKMDRIVKGQNVNDEFHKRFFLSQIGKVEQHLAMVFHRFMEGKRPLKIHIQGNPIEPWDPFLKLEEATQQIADEKITLFQKEIKVVPYVLPHISKLTPEKHKRAAGVKGWNLHQGFYIYRNKRLLVAGDWLGLPFAKEEHFKLARIQLDIPNSMDHEWEIDVTKSKARPPYALRKDLKHVADVTRQHASDIYRHRGRVLARANSQEFIFVWEQKVKQGRYFYRINRQHPFVRQVLKTGRKEVEGLLRMIEETVPVPILAITNAEHPDKHSVPFEESQTKEVAELLQQVYRAIIDAKIPLPEAIKMLRVMEPFDRFPELIESFREQLQREKA